MRNVTGTEVGWEGGQPLRARPWPAGYPDKYCGTLKGICASNKSYEKVDRELGKNAVGN